MPNNADGLQTYDGYTGQILLDGDALILTRRGLPAKAAGLGGEPRRVPLAALSGVAFTPATRMTNGSIRLGLGGARPREEDGGATSDAVMFRHRDNDTFGRLHDWLVQVVAHNTSNGIDPASVDYDQPARSLTERMQDSATSATETRTEKWAGKVGADRPDIAAAAGRLNVTIGAKREIKHLHEYLHDGETVSLIAPGKYSANIGIVVLTDQRLLFVFHGLVKAAQEDFPLRAITSVQTKSGFISGDLNVTVSGMRSTISNVPKADLSALATAIREGMTVGPTPPAPDAPGAGAAPKAVDPVDALTQLGRLRVAGLLSPEEFEAKKQEILGRL